MLCISDKQPVLRLSDRMLFTIPEEAIDRLPVLDILNIKERPVLFTSWKVYNVSEPHV